MVIDSMSYATYERYKDSGVDWLGEIPSDWDLQPAFKYIKENKTKNTGLLENTVLSLSYGKIIIKPEEKLTGLVPESFETYQIVEPNDIIIRCTDLQNDKVSLRTGLVENRGIITSAYLGLKVFQNYNSKFLHYYLHSLDITKAIYKFGTGLRQNLSFLDFKRLPLVDISLDLQQKIANFLDQKTAQIDQAIALKQQQIEKLNEYKQIVIQNAVTKGLNPNAPMKNSGVDWIGEIPEHWEVKKLKYLIDSKAGYAFPSQQFSQEGISVIRISELNINGSVDISNSPKLPFSFAKFLEEFCVVSGDILMAMTGGTIGKVSIYRESKKSLLNQRVCKFIVKASLDKKLFWHFCNSLYWKNYIDFKANGGAQPNISDNEIKKMYFPLPSISEQKTIANFLDEKTQNINQTIERYQTQIDRLKEYKNILINQAVTGKIKI